MQYHLEMEKAIQEIKSKKAKKVCIQLPDGLKQYAKEITDKIRKETETNVYIWLGSCFGACDIPEGIKKIGIDLLIQWGHSSWK